ncbi:MAG: flagellar basal-body rod protein FlgG [Candidatus Margulisiibacteriota bacterium]
MFQPLYVAATGLNAFEEEMSNITNNLSNAKTVAFKKGRVEKESMFYVNKTFSNYLDDAVDKRADLDNPRNSIESGLGVRVVGTPKDFSQGTIEVTNNPLDMAIEGEGFFQMRLPDGSIAYGRAGDFHADNAGNLVDPNGRLLDPPVVFPDNTTSVLVKSDGTIMVSINDSLDLTEIGQLSLAKFSNPSGLKSLGQNLYAQTDAAGDPMIGVPGQTGFGTIQQSALEQANVDIITEMMKMVMIQRVFDTVTKAIQSYDQMVTAAIQMKG